MKYIKILIVILLLYCPKSYSQSRYGYKFPSGTIKSAISKSGNLYAGIDNPLIVSLPGFNYDDYSVSSNNGEVFIDSLELKVVPIRTGDIRFMISKTNSDSTEYLGHSKLKVHNLPSPRLKLNALTVYDTTSISSNELPDIDSISVFISEDIPDSDSWYSVKEFSIGYNYGGIYIGTNNIGSALTSDTRKLIKQMRPNRYLSINAIIRSSTGVTKSMPLVKVYVY